MERSQQQSATTVDALVQQPPDRPEMASETPDPLQALERKDLARSIDAALDRLPPNQRAAVLLARVEEMSYAEIAQILEISEGAVDGLLQRARRSLTRLLASAL